MKDNDPADQFARSIYRVTIVLICSLRRGLCRGVCHGVNLAPEKSRTGCPRPA